MQVLPQKDTQKNRKQNTFLGTVKPTLLAKTPLQYLRRGLLVKR